MALDFSEFGWRLRNSGIARKANSSADFEHLYALLRIASDSSSCGRPLRHNMTLGDELT